MRRIFVLIFFFLCLYDRMVGKEKLTILDYINTRLDNCIVTPNLNNIDKIYVINLDIRYEKWINTRKQLERFDVIPERVAGINGWGLDRKYLKNLYRNCIGCCDLTPGQIGCLLSHLSILQDALIRRYHCIWVLEDDIFVMDDIRQLPLLIDKMNVFDSEWDVLFTDVNARGRTFHEVWTFEMFLNSQFDYSLVKDPCFIPRENEDFKRIEYRLGTHSMIISSRGIKKLLEYFQRIKIMFPLDVQMQGCPTKRFYVSKKEYVTNAEREVSDTSCKPH